MTDHDLAAAHEAVKRIEAQAQAGIETERDTATGVYRNAVALRRALGNWIVMRATSAPQTAETR